MDGQSDSRMFPRLVNITLFFFYREVLVLIDTPTMGFFLDKLQGETKHKSTGHYC